MIMKKKIKPCPFCGSKAKLLVTKTHIKNGPTLVSYDIKCTNKECYMSEGADWLFSKPKQAIKLWNKRK